jgi:phosphoribosylanthranilate isomerase
MTAPHVKICGITRLEDAEAALRLGAEFLGLNFYAGSPRAIEVAAAARLRRRVGDRARVVGVFVNHAAAEVSRIAAEVGLDLLQFHGDEGPLDLEPHGARAIKVYRVAGPLPHAELDRYPRAWGFLFDSSGGSGYGGSGVPWAWDAAGALPQDRPLFVAGGIKPGNVAEVMARLKPWGIDVGSGVEAAPGRKDPALLERLFEEIAHAQDAVTS